MSRPLRNVLPLSEATLPEFNDNAPLKIINDNGRLATDIDHPFDIEMAGFTGMPCRPLIALSDETLEDILGEEPAAPLSPDCSDYMPIDFLFGR